MECQSRIGARCCRNLENRNRLFDAITDHQDDTLCIQQQWLPTRNADRLIDVLDRFIRPPRLLREQIGEVIQPNDIIGADLDDSPIRIDGLYRFVLR